MSKKIKIMDRDWWKHTIIYQVYPRSFQDTNDDGIGDLKGIISHLDHFVYLNIGAVWLSPVYCSPMYDYGYDITDHKNIDPLFGTLMDFDELTLEAHKRDIKIIMDFIPNQTSSLHPWFIRSCEAGIQKDDTPCDNPYKDYFIWRDGKVNKATSSKHLNVNLKEDIKSSSASITNIDADKAKHIHENLDQISDKPNNWISVFNGPAWTWNEQRQQYYLHQFTPQQPDLNYRNPSVVREMLDVLQFWLDRDVDGFRVDAVKHIYKDERFLDEPRNKHTGVGSDHYDYLEHVYTTHQPEVHDLMRKFRNLFDEHEEKTGKYIFMVAEVYDGDSVECMKYYHSGADMPFNFTFTSLNVGTSMSGTHMKKEIQSWLKNMPEGKWSNYTLSNHDISRITTRVDLLYADCLNIMLLTLPGTSFTYYGEEIAMVDIQVHRFKDVKDPFAKNFGPEKYKLVNRDPCRSPMQWDDGINAGFSRHESTWLPVHPSYKCRNVKAQLSQSISHLNIYRRTALIRKNESFRNADIKFHVTNDNILSYFRHENIINALTDEKKRQDDDDDDGQEIFLIVLNVGFEISTDDYSSNDFKSAFVLLNSETDQHDNSIISLESLTLKPGQGLILKIVN